MRVEKNVQNGVSTVYIYSGDADIAEYDNGAAPSSPSREYIYDNGGLLATISGTTTTYHHSDQLSVRLSTDGTTGSQTYGQVVGQQGDYPFGDAWYAQNTITKQIFTSYQDDAESGLYYALARYYDPRTATYCSADPWEGNPNDPQSWNRYSYVENDPVNLADPTGKSFLSWLVNIVLSILDLLTGGASSPFHAALMAGTTWSSPTSFPPLPPIFFGGGISPTFQNAPIQQLQSKQGKPVNCGSWSFIATIVGPLPQASGTSPLTGRHPQNGDIALNPVDFGFSDYYKVAAEINPKGKTHPNTAKYPNSQAAYKAIVAEQRDLADAHITITPTSKLPKGIPSAGPYSGSDVYDTAHHRPDTVDLYRAPTKQAADNLGRVPITGIVHMIPNHGLHCPQQQ